MLDMRPYQVEAQKAIEAEWKAGHKKTLLVLPTGTGKTIVFSHIVKNAAEDGRRCLILAHRDELISQAQDKLRAAVDIECGIEKAGSTCLGGDFRVVVGSVQTLSRDKRLYKFPYDYFDTIVVDEAHHILAEGYQKVLDHFSDARVLGVTATAERGDERELSEFFDSLAYEYRLTDAIKDGYLCPIKAQTIPLKIDVSSVKLKKGDFDVTQIGSVLTPYLEAIADKMVAVGCLKRKTVVFLPLIKTSERFSKILESRGFKVAEVHGTSKDRPDILQDFNDGKLNVLCNSMLLVEGWDCPSVDTIIVLRPTKIRGFYCQMIGRGTRISPGKSNLLLLDFLWLTGRHELCRPADLVARDNSTYCTITEKLCQSVYALDLVATAEMIADREAALAEVLAQHREQYDIPKKKMIKTYHGSSFAICSSDLSADDIKNISFNTTILTHLEWSGNTYPMKDKIRQLGFRWDSRGKAWVSDLGMSLSEIAEMIKKIKSTDGLYLSDDMESLLPEIEKKAKDFYENGDCQREETLRKLHYRVLMDQLGATPRAIVKLMKSSDPSILAKIDSWINPSSTACPSQCDLAFISTLREKQLKEVEGIVSKAIESRDKKGVTTVRLPYYMSQKECAQHWRMANATLRLAGERLEREGFRTEFITVEEANDRSMYKM